MIGEKIIRLNAVDSTNNYIKENMNHLPNGTIVTSNTQTRGRGRGNHVWESDLGNLYFSFIIKNDIGYNKVFELLSKVSLAVVNTLNHFNVKTLIKYPNDILIKNKKISGILIETYGNLELEGVIIGVGINVNQTNFNELNNKATSVKSITDENLDISNVLSKFIQSYNDLSKQGKNEIYNGYIRNSMVIGKDIDYNGKTYKVETVLETGELLISNKEDVMRLSLNEVNLKELYNETNN